MQDTLLHLFGRRFAGAKDHASPWSYETPSLPFLRPADPLCISPHRAGSAKTKRGCEITIISFSRFICRGGLTALIGVTGKPYPSYLSCHSHPIRPCGAPSPRE